MQKVWYREAKKAWFVTLLEGGRQKQVRLSNAPNTKEGKRLAEDQLLKELQARDYSQAKEAEEPAACGWITISHVLNGFLKHSKEEHAKETAAWHETLLTPFLNTYGKLRITRLRKKHVKAWIKKKGYNSTSASKAIGVLKRAFNWAVEEEHIPRNPIAHVRKPKPLTRDRTLTPDERQLILSSIKDDSFRQFVNALTLTGARPGEVAKVTAADVDVAQGLWILQKHKTVKKTGKPRIIHLPPEALELTKELMVKHPTGPLFLNYRKLPWTRNAVRIRFRRLRAKHLELKGIVAYTYRGSFATDALEAGVPDASVAALLGHTGTATLHKFYNRLSSRTDHLKEAAAKATQQGANGVPADTP